MPRLFVSYSGRDHSVALTVHEELEAAGITVWRDERRIEADWKREIAAAVSDCDALLLLWSRHANQSRFVKHEWLTARALGKPIYPLVLQEEQDQLPPALYSLPAIAFAARDSLIQRIAS